MMRNAFCYLIFFLIAVLTLPAASSAQNGWVSDILVLTFRQGPGNNYNVEKTLTSNTPVAILDEQNGFYKVELGSGDIGWVDKKFIIFEPPKAVLLEQERKKTGQLQQQIDQLTGELTAEKEKLTSTKTAYSNQLTPLEESMKQATAENKQIKKELDDARKKYNTLVEQSKNIQQIVGENKKLSAENKELSAQLNVLEGKNRNLFKTAMIKWFLAGVGVLLLGWIIGQSVSSKKRGYGSLLD